MTMTDALDCSVFDPMLDRYINWGCTCGADPWVRHFSMCGVQPIYAEVIATVSIWPDPLPPGCPAPSPPLPACDGFEWHLWMYCPDCERTFGEVNGSLTGHVCTPVLGDRTEWVEM